MGFWTRDKKDGQKTAGYGVYLVAGMLAVGLVIYAATKLRAVQPTVQASKARRAVVDLGDTQSAAVGMHQAQNAERPKGITEVSSRGVLDDPDGDGNPSEKGKSSNRTGSTVTVPGRSTGAKAVEPSAVTSNERDTAGGIESINVAMRIAEDASKPQLDEGAGFFEKSDANASRYQALPKTVWATEGTSPDGQRASGRNGQQVKSSMAMVVYSSNVDRELVAEKEKLATEEKASDRTFVLPRGEWIPCYLLTNVESGDFGDEIIELGVAAPVYFNHRMQIPFGTRIFANVSGKAVRMRMGLSASGIRYPNGLELPLEGAVRGEDRSSGVPAYYIAASDWAQISPFVGSFLDAWIAAEKQSARGTGGAGGLLSALVGENATTKEFNPGAEAGIAAATGLNDLLKDRLKDVQERFGAHLMIPAGTMVWVQLTADAYLAEAHVKPKQPWTGPLPASTQMASLARLAATERKGLAAAGGAAVRAATGSNSAIERLLQAAASGDASGAAEAAEAAVNAAEKSPRPSVISKQPSTGLALDAQDFFPSKSK